MSYYTGTPQVSIPLGEVVSGSLKVPLSLSYNASGNRVGDMASWVGQGWALNAGGVITRVMRGKPDDANYGTNYFNFTATKPAVGRIPDALDRYEVSRGCADASSDVYSFNFNGHMGQFVFDWRGNIIQLADQKLLITPIRKSTGPAAGRIAIVGWRVQTPDGNTYRFLATETTLSHSTSDGVKNCTPARGTEYISAWYVSSITDMNRNDSIMFTYDSYRIQYSRSAAESVRYGSYSVRYGESPSGFCGCPDGESPKRTFSPSSQLSHEGIRVQRITTSDGQTKVVFEPGASRLDVGGIDAASSYNLKTLAAVVFYNPQGEVKRYSLQYDTAYIMNRLTLKAVDEENGVLKKPPYRLTYNELPLPDINSLAQDHWGFYNGATANNSLIPPFTRRFKTANTQQPLTFVYYPGAN